MNLRQARSLRHGQILHYTGRQHCGDHNKVIKVRVSGEVKTWKRSPERIQVPVKYGLYESSYITEDNLDDYHLAEECPLLLNPQDSEEEYTEPEDEPKVLKLSGRMVEIPTTEQEFRQTIKGILG